MLLMATPNIEKKRVTCSSCGKSEAFTDYELVSDVLNNSSDTVLPGGNRGTVYLVDDASGERYRLNIGVNCVGRNAKTSSADVRIFTDDFSISRMHSYFTVSESSNGALRCSISNAKNKFPTLVNGVELEDGDVLPVAPGDVITLASSKFYIEIID